MLSVHVVPRSSRCRIQGIHGDALKVSLNSPPVDGRANAELISFLADTFHVHRRQIKLIGGDSSRKKRILIKGIKADSIVGCIESGPL